MKRTRTSILYVLVLTSVFITVLYYWYHVTRFDDNAANEYVTKTDTNFTPTERYRGQIDRVSVVFAHQDYTRYELTTNGLVRTGELNTERGFGDDIDATVYVLNWQQPVGEQIVYVRLTREPGVLYLLDSERQIVPGSKLFSSEN